MIKLLKAKKNQEASKVLRNEINKGFVIGGFDGINREGQGAGMNTYTCYIEFNDSIEGKEKEIYFEEIDVKAYSEEIARRICRIELRKYYSNYGIIKHVEYREKGVMYF